MITRSFLSIVISMLGLTALCTIAVLGYRDVYIHERASVLYREQLPTLNVESSEKKVLSAMNQHEWKISIPKINVNANIQSVGLDKNGNMGVPSNFKDVAWYKHGPQPGEVGSAVIAGHVDNALGLPGVFNDLHKLAEGDLIHVKDSDGKLLMFRVIKKEIYEPEHTQNAEIFSMNDTARLNLITCDGVWIQSKKSYSERLVVFTELVNS